MEDFILHKTLILKEKKEGTTSGKRSKFKKYLEMILIYFVFIMILLMAETLKATTFYIIT